MDTLLQRKSQARIFDHRETVTIVGDDGAAHRFAQEGATLVRAVLGLLIEPHTAAHVVDAIRVHSEDGEDASARVVTELLHELAACGVISDESESAKPPTTAPSSGLSHVGVTRRPRLLLGLTGAVATIHSARLVQTLLARGFDVRVAMTPTATRFASPEGLEALTHRAVARDIWPRDASEPVPHVNLAKWAELVLIYPTSATTLSRLAAGDFSELVASICLTANAPVVLAPSMNPAMYFAPSVQRNLSVLIEDGFYVVHPARGHELADAPEQRTSRFGPAPSIAIAADLAVFIWRHVSATTAPAHEMFVPAPAIATSAEFPVSANEWDQAYARGSVEQLRWYAPNLDSDMESALLGLVHVLSGSSECGGSSRPRLLDVGTGAGTVAVAAAALGFDVVGTDHSSVALTLAQRRAGPIRVAWVIDDFLDSRLWGSFDVAVDRGCFGVIAPERRGAYVSVLAARLRPGGTYLLKVHSRDEKVDRGVHRFSADEIERLFASYFRLLSVTAGQFDGPMAERPRALLCRFERTG